ncbi:Dps family protein [Lacicoccus qingdaonensis]|uniref:Starvation-inducible DNA-binding protein n=1 Tax=Lacicoccus qingdaonensis TaxID=576118 RepID=A0A1G9C1H5_9BACL|nr:Dps family protein [Salinicoccus qingdaonensis]SDK45478.1 starvation-inducible DNA-binding protein [Salinicoccus qingdaonensis]
MVQITEKNRVIESLNKQLANHTVLWGKLHNYHWYVKGPHFFSLHTKFEELYDSTGVIVDDIAERILAIGGQPIAKLKEALEESSIDEGEYGLSAESMVKQLVDDYDVITAELRSGVKEAEDAGDDSTADMYIAYIQGIEKDVWMLQAYLGEDVSK